MCVLTVVRDVLEWLAKSLSDQPENNETEKGKMRKCNVGRNNNNNTVK